MVNLITRIMNAYPVGFFRVLSEYIDAGFAEAWTLANRHAEEPERLNMLGQFRHSRCEAGFRRAAQEAGLTVTAPHTQPLGGRYSIVCGSDVYIVRSNIQKHCGPPRASGFRKNWASINASLFETQGDLFKCVPPSPDQQLCTMLVTTANTCRGDQSVPAFVGIGIPSSTLSVWKTLISLPDLLARYHDADTATRKTGEMAVTLKDVAVPRLKMKPNQE
ncbi:hypothetical protein [Insolitispirillum peregrinum]|uniref:Uncharacterized protein n=1 Tax=Insolitispirillum peregrinum TaxID=80876 RepID=A0A1N7LMR2_9PROT|nr:hypothetical protein [Insolitispirillum peregrinum]SIS75106.1 hypothetical protein SAMN05421779_103430 [Insolitispirillum peregrinum]